MKRIAVVLIFLILLHPAFVTAADRLTITASVANIRSGPGTQYDTLWEVEKYYPIMVIKTSGSWYYFRDFEDDRGWVHKSLVGEVEAVITAKEHCNIRSGPSTDDKILGTVEKGIPFKVLKHQGRWLNIEHADGDQGWIYDSLVW